MSLLRSLHAHALLAPAAQCGNMGYDDAMLSKITRIVGGSGIEQRYTCNGSSDPLTFLTRLEAPGVRPAVP